ncbi:tannase/feruloyl esterase family alpha/beta hydrolase [Sphaerotilus natans]|nr:tannase/feruloyl esterase family alpha/beta hydrolase [Sphaerotilus natans]
MPAVSPSPIRPLPLALAAAALLGGCAGLPGPASPAAPVTPMAAARPGALQQCAELAASFRFAHTRLTAAEPVAADALKIAGQPVGAHCRITGVMHERTSPVDGQRYAIGFEMRLPQAWNGRFLYQANGGLDGLLVPATGPVGGRGGLTNALQQGFAVISSDAGHDVKQLPLFGLDPQARLDYGYQAVAKLTPMAKALVAAGYGRPADRAYFSGCSNGGRHAFVTAARLPEAYDGILAGAPGYNLPQAAVAQIHGAQQFARVATDPKDLKTAITPAERQFFAQKLLARCDTLDGVADGMVQDVAACQKAFDLQRDVPACDGNTRTGQCLTGAQKTALGQVLAGARDSAGRALYTSFPADPGFVSEDWANWKFVYSVSNRDPVALGYVFMVPPAPKEMLKDTLGYALSFHLDRDAPGIFRTDATFTESAMQFMTPPKPAELGALRARGAKMLVWHGTSDGVFSTDASVAWYRDLQKNSGGDASDFAQLYLVPGMNHCGGGPATDQFNLLQPLVDWVEKGQAPAGVTAQVRGPGNPGGANTELPAGWSPERSRPLCAWPKVARYAGGDLERATSFRCE